MQGITDEYLFIIGINKLCFNASEKIELNGNDFLVTWYSNSIMYAIKFLKSQERGKLKDISCINLKRYDYSHIEYFYQYMNYDFEEYGARCVVIPGYIEFYELFCKFYKKIKDVFDDDDDDCVYMFPIEHYSYLKMSL